MRLFLVLPLVFTLPCSELTVTYDIAKASFTVSSNIPNLEVTMTDNTIWFVVIEGEEEMDTACFEWYLDKVMWTLQEVRGPLILDIEACVEAPEISIANDGALTMWLPAWALAGNMIQSVDLVWTEWFGNTLEKLSQTDVITRGVRAPGIC
jgi:hypothetical protein